ncbi:hypothetical protein GUJ93_ZPchr0013g35104 [Zizania palustris]|uniref:Uncharacterized protein n=1 Tax=Zizania palustris TaxID=103762 RepID=A0A8J5X545_ZIZPA|nr:hypothetical protein GUJ93_ZPchr0013g35104 [Zizania palustris]
MMVSPSTVDYPECGGGGGDVDGGGRRLEPSKQARLESAPRGHLRVRGGASTRHRIANSVTPFISRIAPSDTYMVWKRDTNLCSNMTLAGFNVFKI